MTALILTEGLGRKSSSLGPYLNKLEAEGKVKKIGPGKMNCVWELC